MIKQLRLLFLIVLTLPAWAQNPFLPLGEYIPDAEPYVFEDPDQPGHMRVYIYGSHDVLGNAYCGRDQVVWSAPVDDLTQWRYEGVSFRSVYDRDGQPLNADTLGDILYAPDVAMRMENGRPVYYLYPNTQADERRTMVARALRPAGPFTVCNWSIDDPKKTEGILGFDPAVFVDDDGRVYGYWGFDEAYCAELDPQTMCTLREGTSIHRAHIPSRHQDNVFRFYEASSMRKIEDKYVFIYSRWTAPGEFGLPDVNYTLAYAYGDSPLGPFTYGGTLIDGRAPMQIVSADSVPMTIPTAHHWGNTHGSLFCANGQYWLVYHRQTGNDEYHRQAMAAPLHVHVEAGKGGKVLIKQAEYTSEGFAVQGLNPLQPIPAGLACHYTGGAITTDSIVTNIRNHAVVGYKYINLDYATSCRHLAMSLGPLAKEMDIIVRLDDPTHGPQIGQYHFAADSSTSADLTQLILDIPIRLKGKKGKHAIYFLFRSSVTTPLCDLITFQFKQ